MKPTRLTPAEIREALGSLRGWRREGRSLSRAFEFDTYAAGLAFAVRLGRRADRVGHHPDLLIGYGRVTVRWSTHDAGGITALDVEGARMTDRIRGA